MKNIVSTVVAVIALLCSPAYGQAKPPIDPVTSAAVRKMLVVMDYRNVMKASMAQMSKSMPAVMRSTVQSMVDGDASLNNAQRVEAMKEVEKMIPVVIAKVDSVLSDPVMADEMIEAIVPVWARIYTVNEIEQMTAFYTSPVGKKMLASMPQLMAEGMQAGQQIISPRINAVMADLIKTLKK